MKVIFKATQLSALLSTLLLLGCGAAGGNVSPTSQVSSRSGSIDKYEPVYEHCTDPVLLNEELLKELNKIRSSSQVCRGKAYPDVAELKLDSRLENAAIVHSDDMATHNFLSHTGSDGSHNGDRATREGYNWSHIAENLAGNASSVSVVVEAWMDSDGGHCEAIMAAQVQDIGAACIYREDSDYRYYWSLELGAE